jgi:hypothetical protein
MRLASFLVAVMLTGLWFTPRVASAQTGTETAKAHYKRGLGAFALGRYAEAAEAYESAFAIEPDPALLYNAAQAHRAANNKERALTLYRNYLRIFASAPNRVEVQRHIATLEKAIEIDRATATAPPSEPIKTTTPMTPIVPPRAEPPPPTTTAVTPAPPATTTATVVTTPPPAPRQQRPKWVWGVVGGAVGVVVIGVAVGLGVGLSGTRYPRADIGDARVE